MPNRATPFSQLDSNDIRQAVIFLDVDGTLVADHQADITPELLEKVRSLSKENTVYICSNGSHGYAKEIAALTGTKAIPCRKPFSGEMKTLSADSHPIVIGDKFLTDGLLARGLHARFIKTPHMRGAHDSLVARLTYFVDDIAWSIQPYAYLMRPWHWVKNLLVFAPLFFAGTLMSVPTLVRVLWAFVAFCLTASLVYVLNDIHDRESDAKHPYKRFRPLAAGDVSVTQALLFSIGLLILDALVLWQVPVILWPLVTYVVLNIGYSKWIKHISVADIVCVSIFYLLRVLVGGFAAPAPLSPWIILCTFFGSLFVIIGKRRAEFRHESRRAVLEQYSAETLDLMLVSSMTLSVISYGIWSIIGHASTYLVYTTLFVLFAVFRTMNRMFADPSQGESPETLVFRDPWIVGSFLLWAISVFIIFYRHF